MERIDGYLVIDECKRVVSDKNDEQYWVYIDDEEYYFKPTVFDMGNEFVNFAYKELVGYQAAKFLGIDACYTDLAVINGNKGIISKSLRKEGINLVSGNEILGDYIADNFDIVKDMGMGSELASQTEKYGLGDTTRYFSAMYINNLEMIWQALEYRYKDKINIKSIMHQFVLMYMFTIILGDADKHPGNWFILENGENIKLAPLFDNGNILIGYEEGYDIDKIKMNFSTNFKDYEVNLVQTLKVFLETSGEEYFDLFVNIFDKMLMNFDAILDMVEKQIGVEIPEYEKEKIIVAFNKNSEKITEIIDSFKIKRQRK